MWEQLWGELRAMRLRGDTFYFDGNFSCICLVSSDELAAKIAPTFAELLIQQPGYHLGLQAVSSIDELDKVYVVFTLEDRCPRTETEFQTLFSLR